MKKTLYFAAAALALVACAKEAPVNEDIAPKGETVTITASLTKTEYAGSGVFNWQDAETISVGTSEGVYVTFDVADKAAGTFSHTFSGTAPALGLAVSPVQGGSYASTSDYRVSLPATYDYVEGTTNALLIGTPVEGESYKFQFRHAAALLKVTYENAPVGTTGLVFTANESITGDFNLSGTSASDIEIANTTATGKTVTISMPATTAEKDLSFYIPVPTGEYTGFSMNLTGSADIIASTGKTVENTFTIKRGQTLVLPAITLASGFTPVTVGATDNSALWTDEAHGDAYAIPAGKILHLEFVNYSSKLEFFHNWDLFVANSPFGSAGYSEYFVLRADNYGWGDANYNKGRLTSSIDWSVMKEAMDGASVTLTIEHTTAGSIIVNAESVSADKAYTFTESYNHPGPLSEDIYAFLWCERSHFVVNKVWYSNSLKTVSSLTCASYTSSVADASTVYNYYVYDEDLDLSVIGSPRRNIFAVYNDGSMAAIDPALVSVSAGTTVKAEAGKQNCPVSFMGETKALEIPVIMGTGAFGSTTLTTSGLQYSPFFGDVAPGTSVSKTMYVYSSNTNNWSSPCADCASAGFAKFYASVRMDNWGWGDNFASATLAGDWNWDIFGPMQNHDTVKITWTNNSSTCDVRFDATYCNGETHYQLFTGIPIENEELAYRSFTENSYVVVLD